jgi:hypothetical protein
MTVTRDTNLMTEHRCSWHVGSHGKEVPCKARFIPRFRQDPHQSKKLSKQATYATVFKLQMKGIKYCACVVGRRLHASESPLTGSRCLSNYASSRRPCRLDRWEARVASLKVVNSARSPYSKTFHLSRHHSRNLSTQTTVIR